MAQALPDVAEPERWGCEDHEEFEHGQSPLAEGEEEWRQQRQQTWDPRGQVQLTESAVAEEGERLAQKLTLRETEHWLEGAEGTMAPKSDARTIVVSGLNPSTADECLRYFCENTRRSGGGPVEMVERLEDTRVLVRFKDAQDARTIVVSGLNPSTADECLRYFCENTRRSGGGPVEMVERLEDTRALVRFKDAQDAESVLTKAQLKLEGYTLSASAPDTKHGHLSTRGVSSEAQNQAASDISGTVSSEHENTDPDKTAAESSRSDEGRSKDSQPNAEIFTRKQTIANLSVYQLKVLDNPRVLHELHKECPGVEVWVDMKAETAHVTASENTVKQACAHIQRLTSALGEVKVQLSPALCRMYGTAQHVVWIQRTLIEHLDLLCHWELQDQSLIICAQGSKLPFLEQLFRSIFVEIKVHLEERELTLLKGGWESLVEVLTKDRGECPTPVMLLEKDGVAIVDTPSNISQTQLSLRTFLEVHRDPGVLLSAEDGVCVEKLLPSTHVCRDIPNLKAGQQKVLSCPTVLEKWYQEHPDLHIHVDQEKQMAVVTASENTMKKVFVEIMSFVTVIKEVKLPLSPSLVKMFEKEDSREWVQRVLVDRNVHRCHWEVCDHHVVVSGQNSDLFGLEQTFKSAFREVTVRLQQRERSVLSPNVWMLFVEKQQRDKMESPAPVLLLENDRVVIVDVTDNVECTQLALRQLLDEHTTIVANAPVLAEGSSLHGQPSPLPFVEECIPYLKPGQLSLLSMPNALSKLYKQYPGLTVRTDRDRKTAIVGAPENVMQEAFSDVLSYVTLVRESKVLLSPALVQMYQKDGNREWIQLSLIDRYELLCHWDVCDQHLTISAQSANLQRLEKMFTSLFKEVKVRVDQQELAALTPSVLQSFVESQQRDREDGPAPTLLLDGRCVTVVDVPSKASATQQALERLLNKHGHGQARVPSSHARPEIPTVCFKDKTLSDLNPGQLRVLSSPAVLDRLRKECPGLQVTVRQDIRTAVLTAPENIAQKAFAKVLSSVSDVRELKVDLSPALGLMFEKEDSKEWIQTSLVDKYQLACHWELCDQHLILSAAGSKLVRLEHLFSSVFKEMTVSLKEWRAGTLSPPVWRSYVMEQESHRKGCPTPVLLLDDDSVTIVDIAARVQETHLALLQLLDDLGS